jgi:hypothetical protein
MRVRDRHGVVNSLVKEAGMAGTLRVATGALTFHPVRWR